MTIPLCTSMGLPLALERPLASGVLVVVVVLPGRVYGWGIH